MRLPALRAAAAAAALGVAAQQGGADDLAGVPPVTETRTAADGTLHTITHKSKILPHVFTVDDNPHVAGVECPQPDSGALVLRLRDARAAVEWTQPGAILVGSGEQWACFNEHGLRTPFIRRVLALQSVAYHGLRVTGDEWSWERAFLAPDQPPVAVTLTLSAQPAQPHECFEYLDVTFTRKHPAGGAGGDVGAPHAGGGRALAATSPDSAHARQLGCAWWNVVCWIIEAALALLRFLLNLIYAILRPLSWGFRIQRHFNLFGWNWNAKTRAPANPDLPLIGQVVRCDKCFAYLDLDILFELRARFILLESINFLAELSSKARFAPYFKYNDARYLQDSIDIWRNNGLFTLAFSIGIVPIWIDFGASVGLGYSLSTSGAVFVAPPAVTLDAGFAVGIYINIPKLIVQPILRAHVTPGLEGRTRVSIDASLRARTELLAGIRIALWSMLPFSLITRPYFELEANANIDNMCGFRAVDVRGYVGVDGTLQMEQPKLEINIWGVKIGLPLPIPGFKTDFVMSPKRRVHSGACFFLCQEAVRRLLCAEF